MTLSEQQRIFTSLVAKLVTFAYDEGYELAYGEVARSDEQAIINSLGTSGRVTLSNYLDNHPVFKELARAVRNNAGSGIKNSLHEKCLAVDFKLFVAGVYQTQSASYRKLGTFWKTLHPLCRWGGDWGDGNHFSMEYGGIK